MHKSNGDDYEQVFQRVRCAGAQGQKYMVPRAGRYL
jgi:hypothetical protein